MRIKLVSVLITLLIASVVMFAGCIEEDEYTKVSEIAASPASTPIILPTSTPAQITPSTSAPIPASVPEVAYDKIGDVVSNKAAYNNKIIKIKGQADTIHIPTSSMILIATAVLTEGMAPIDIGDSADVYAMIIEDDTGWMNVWILKSMVDEKGIEYGGTIELVGAFYYIQEKYSCQACGGDGMFGENIACSVCGGAGMVNLENPLIPQEFQADYFTWVKKVQNVGCGYYG